MIRVGLIKIIWSCGLLALSLAIQSPAQAGTAWHALLIGNNQYVGDSAQNLSFAHRDALGAAELFALLQPTGTLALLVDPRVDSTDDSAFRTRLDALSRRHQNPSTGQFWHLSPSKAGLEQAMIVLQASLEQARARGDETALLVQFAGHGDPDGFLHLADQRLPLAWLQNRLLELGADRSFLLLDGCFLARGMVRGQTPPPPVRPEVFVQVKHPAPGHAGLKNTGGTLSRRGMARQNGLMTLAATTSVLEDPGLERGLLSLLLWSCLAGVGDSDHDGQVVWHELSSCVADQVSMLPSAPGLVASRAEQDPFAAVLERPSKVGGIRVKGEALPGFLLVRRHATREVIARFFHFPGESIQLALSPGRYELIRLEDRMAPSLSPPPHSPAFEAVYPTQTMTFDIERETVTLPSPDVPIRRLAYVRGRTSPSEVGSPVPSGLPNLPPESVLAGYEWVSIGWQEEQLLRDLPNIMPVQSHRRQVPERWQLTLLGYVPQASMPLSGAGAWQPGANLQVGWTRKGIERGRLALWGEALMGYGVRSDEEYVGAGGVASGDQPSLWHLPSLGSGVQGEYRGRRLTTGLELALSWAPLLRTGESVGIDFPDVAMGYEGSRDRIWKSLRFDSTLSLGRSMGGHSRGRREGIGSSLLPALILTLQWHALEYPLDATGGIPVRGSFMSFAGGLRW